MSTVPLLPQEEYNRMVKRIYGSGVQEHIWDVLKNSSMVFPESQTMNHQQCVEEDVADLLDLLFMHGRRHRRAPAQNMEA